MQELSNHGWSVPGEPFWNHVHGAWWTRPDIRAIVRAYEKAHTHAARRREESRTFTDGYDLHTVAPKYWEAVVGRLCGGEAS